MHWTTYVVVDVAVCVTVPIIALSVALAFLGQQILLNIHDTVEPAWKVHGSRMKGLFGCKTNSPLTLGGCFPFQTGLQTSDYGGWVCWLPPRPQHQCWVLLPRCCFFSTRHFWSGHVFLVHKISALKSKWIFKFQGLTWCMYVACVNGFVSFEGLLWKMKIACDTVLRAFIGGHLFQTLPGETWISQEQWQASQNVWRFGSH